MENIVFNVHQPGLRRGAERLPFAPHKKYFYVEHPIEGWRVYLRACCFIHESGDDDPQRFLVVKAHGAKPTNAVWEPPKGQMEGKDGLAHPNWTILDLLTENVQREVGEEAKIHSFDALQYTGLVLQGQEKDYPPNTFFQYHVFQGFTSPLEIQHALREFAWLHEHPKAWARMKKDKREKDAIEWFNPRRHKLMGKWSPKLVMMYLQNI